MKRSRMAYCGVSNPIFRRQLKISRQRMWISPSGYTNVLLLYESSAYDEHRNKPIDKAKYIFKNINENTDWIPSRMNTNI